MFSLVLPPLPPPPSCGSACSLSSTMPDESPDDGVKNCYGPSDRTIVVPVRAAMIRLVRSISILQIGSQADRTLSKFPDSVFISKRQCEF